MCPLISVSFLYFYDGRLIPVNILLIPFSWPKEFPQQFLLEVSLLLLCMFPIFVVLCGQFDSCCYDQIGSTHSVLEFCLKRTFMIVRFVCTYVVLPLFHFFVMCLMSLAHFLHCLICQHNFSVDNQPRILECLSYHHV